MLKLKLFVYTALSIGLATGALAQTAPKITQLSRAWLQRGTTNEITVTGENLRDLKDVHISGGNGVEGWIVPPKPRDESVGVESSSGGIGISDGTDANHVQIRLVVAPEAAVSRRELRLISTSGVSNLSPLEISSIPEITEERSGNAPQKITLPIGISGVIANPDEEDAYSFSAKKGEELVFDVLAFRTGSALDSSLRILNAAGKELARSEDARGFDSFIHFVVPEDGDYIVRLRDFRYQGSANHKYHLSAGPLPYLDTVFPVGAQRGQDVDVSLQGFNLGGVSHLRLQPASDAPLGWQEVRVRTPNGLSSPFRFNVTDVSQTVESEPNDTRSEANLVNVPIVINGRLGGAKDVDYFRFKPNTAQTLVCEVTAQRLGSPLDAFLTLLDSSGKILQQNDDANGADARIEYSFQKDQEYVLALRDLLGRGGGNYVYQLSIRPPEPGFAVRFSPDTPELFCGGRTVLRCDVTRQNGFNGAVRVECTGLPEGVSAEPLLIKPEDPSGGLLVLTATDRAAGGSHPIKLMATGFFGEKRLVRTAEPMAGESPADDALLTVLAEPAPFALELATLSLNLEQEQSADLRVLLKRRDGFNGEVKLTAEGPDLEAQPMTVKALDSSAILKTKARMDAPSGSYPLYVKGEAKVNGQKVTQMTQLIPMTVQQIPFTLVNTMKRLSVAVLPPGMKSAAAEAEFAIRASRRGWFTDEIELKLDGLPEGITVTSTNLSPHVNEVTFKLVATEKAQPGKDVQITVIGSGMAGGRRYEQRTAPMTLSITKSQDVADAK